MTQGDGRATLLRSVLAGVVVVDLLSFFFVLGDARATADAAGALNPFADLIAGTVVRGAIVAVGVAGAVAFGRKPGRLWQGVLSLGALALLSTAHAQLFGSPWRHLYYSGLALSGWLLGVAVTRHRQAPADESYACMGSMALLAAAYLNAGLSKLVYGGLDWMSGVPIQAIIVSQDGLVADGVASLYRSWVVATPAAAGLFSVATTGLELAAPLMLAGRRIRAAVALGLFGMHANIFVLTHILYWQSGVLLLLFGLSREAPGTDTVPDSAAAVRSGTRTFTAAAALLAVCALLGIGHQARRYAHLEAAKAAAIVVAKARPPAPAPPAPPRQIGPFAVGQPVAEGWTVDALEIGAAGFIVRLSGRPGRAAFEVTCASSEHRSPFDLERAHIFYSSALEYRELKAAGSAVRQAVQEAAAGTDVCGCVAAWRTSAQAARYR